jgi:hypothetical protein
VKRNVSVCGGKQEQDERKDEININACISIWIENESLMLFEMVYFYLKDVASCVFETRRQL